MTLPLDTEADRVLIYPSRAKMLYVLLVSIVIGALGIWIATSGVARELPAWKVAIVSYIATPFFAFGALYAAYRLAIRRPALELDSTGIIDNASAVGVGRLGWDEVDHVVLCKYRGQSMLGIVPRDLNLFLSRQSTIRRSFIKGNLALGCPPITVPQMGLSMNVAELASLLQTRYGVRVEGDA